MVWATDSGSDDPLPPTTGPATELGGKHVWADSESECSPTCLAENHDLGPEDPDLPVRVNDDNDNEDETGMTPAAKPRNKHLSSHPTPPKVLFQSGTVETCGRAVDKCRSGTDRSRSPVQVRTLNVKTCPSTLADPIPVIKGIEHWQKPLNEFVKPLRDAAYARCPCPRPMTHAEIGVGAGTSFLCFNARVSVFEHFAMIK